MKGALIFFVALLISFSCFSQSDFREGYIINLSNDTIQGLIDYKGSLRTLEKCRFKESADSEVVEYTALEISEFHVIGAGYYASLEITIDDRQEQYFVEKLVDGIVDLFFYSGSNEGYYILRTEDGTLYDLKNSKIRIDTESGSYERDKKEYIRSLKYLMNDSPETLENIDYLPFETNKMIDLTQDYHNRVCDEYECIVYTKEKQPIRLKLGIFGGYALSNSSFEGKYVKMFNGEPLASNDLVFGLTLNIMDPNVSERFSLQTELSFQNATYSQDSGYLELSFLKIPLSLKYTMPSKKVKPAFLLGFVYNKWTDVKDVNLVPQYIGGVGAIQTRTYQIGLQVGADLSYSLSEKLAVFLYAKYEYLAGKHFNYWTSDEDLYFTEFVTSRTSILSFSLGLRF